MNNDSINIFLSATENHLIHSIELIYSICKRTNCQINSYILLDSKKSYLDIIEKIDIKNLSIKVIDSSVLDSFLSKKHNVGSITKMAYGRTLIPYLFKDLDRILYLDTDILQVRNGIEELYYSDFLDNCIMACEEISIELFDKKEMANCMVSKYLNSGVILFNIQKIKQTDIDKKIISLLQNPPLFLQNSGMQDQSILNIVFKDNIKFINPKYNTQSILFGYPQYDHFSTIWGYENQLDLIRNCVFSHMQGAKPWEEKWNTWQSWQLPLKQWQYDYYLTNKNMLLSDFPFLEIFY